MLRKLNVWIARFKQLQSDDRGQDLIEYALLALTIGIGAVFSLSFLLSMMGGSYTMTVGEVGKQWQTPNPSGS